LIDEGGGADGGVPLGAVPALSWCRGEGARRAVLLANSGCGVSKCVLKTVCFRFVVFCGVLRLFCDFLRVFCSCFASVLQYFHKTHRTPEKRRNTLENTKKSQYARVLRTFSKSQEQKISTVLHKTSFTKLLHLQNTAKHRKTLAKTVTKRFL